MFKSQLRCALALTVVLLSLAASRAMAVTAYTVPVGTDGNQPFGGALGTSFNTNHAIIVTHLGAFDDDSNGIAAGTTLTTNLWNRANPVAPLATDTFTTGSPGTLADGYRFKPTTPVILPVGFQGMIATGGYNGAEENGNDGVSPFPIGQSTGGGLVTFVQDNRFRGDGNPALFPTNGDGGPTTRYGAGNFQFQAANIAYEIASGAVGTQNTFGGSLGMDFHTNELTRITHLGAFDSGSNGLSNTITVQLWARNENGTPANFGDDTGTLLAQVTFAGTEGELIGGSRFKPLSDATLFNGFNGVLGDEVDATIVAFGYGGAEANGNAGVGGSFGSVFDGFGQLTFEGLSRFGAAGSFPLTPDTGNVNRYGAGTFRFQLVTIPEPATLALLALSAVMIPARRRRQA